MVRIVFSHEYFKMPPCVQTRKTYLLGVTKIHYNNLPEGFITYDTLYSINDNILYYPLPKTDLIILTLFTDSDQSPRVWTTVRRFTPKKYQYYHDNIGKQFDILIEPQQEVR